MSRTAAGLPARRAGVVASLLAAGVFEAVTAVATQDRAAWAASPWREDPYHTGVTLPQVTVLILGVALVARLLVRETSDARGRIAQLTRAAALTNALVGLALTCEWVAVADGAHGWRWGPWNEVTIGGLVVVSALTLAASTLLVRGRTRGAAGRPHDWLGDASLWCSRFPLLRTVASRRVVDRTRRQALPVLVALSVLAASVVTGFQVVGEGTTDPLIVVWFLLVETSAFLAFGLIADAVLVLVARPPRSRRRRAAETALVAGCTTVLVVVAFHDPLWSLLSSRPTTATSLSALTFGAGLAVASVTAAARLARPSWLRRVVVRGREGHRPR